MSWNDKKHNTHGFGRRMEMSNNEEYSFRRQQTPSSKILASLLNVLVRKNKVHCFCCQGVLAKKEIKTRRQRTEYQFAELRKNEAS